MRINFLRGFPHRLQNIFRLSTMKAKSHTVGDPFLDPIQLSTSQLQLAMTEKDPNKMALNSYEQNISLTYQELTQKAIQLAHTLVNDYRLKPKDRVGVYAFNKWEWYVVQLATAFADLILVNINPSYQSE